MIFKNFERYFPEDKKELMEMGICFSKDQDNNDWYDVTKKFPKNTHKLIFDSSGLIIFSGKDATTIPTITNGLSIVDVESLPEDFKINEYVYLDGKIEKYILSLSEMKDKIKKQVSIKLKKIEKNISPLQYAVDLGMATEGEKEKLLQLKKYIVLLNRIPTQEGFPENIIWPEAPVT